MTIKKYYQNGKLASVGFDTLEEVFAFRHANHLLKEIPSNELTLKDDRKVINQIPEFQEFKKRIEGK